MPGPIQRRVLFSGVRINSPDDVPGLVLWLKADAGLWIAHDGSDPAAVSDGDLVGYWQDQSGGGNHIIQATDSKKGTLKVNQQNALPAVRFDGTDDFLRDTFTLAVPFTVLSVAKLRTANSAGRWWCGGSGGTCAYQVWTPGSRELYAGGGANGAGMYADVSGCWDIWADAIINADSSTMRRNAGAQDARATNLGDTSPGGITLAADQADGNCGAVDYGEIIVYNRVLTTAEETAIRNYLNGRWTTY